MFFCEVWNFSEHFFNRTPPLTASAPLVAVSVFLLKKWLNSYFTTFSWHTNNFFFSTHRLMYKKLNCFVYKFVVNFQVFEITPWGCNLWSWKLACLIAWHIWNTILKYLLKCLQWLIIKSVIVSALVLILSSFFCKTKKLTRYPMQTRCPNNSNIMHMVNNKTYLIPCKDNNNS